MKNYIIRFQSVLFVFFLLGSTTTHAGYFGGLNARAANMNTQSTVSVELAYATGEFYFSDYSQLGVRLNYSLSPDIVVFGDLGQPELNQNGDISYGAGLFYALDNPLPWSDALAVKFSYHMADFGSDYSNGTSGNIIRDSECVRDGPAVYLDLYGELQINNDFVCRNTYEFNEGTAGSLSNRRYSNLAIELLTSGSLNSTIAEVPADWYASGGIQNLGGDFNNEIDFSVGAGLVLKNGLTEFYGGAEFAKQLVLGIGVRYSVK